MDAQAGNDNAPSRVWDTEPAGGSNAPQPVRTLREWLDHLAARDRLSVMRPGIGLKFEVAAIAKHLDGRQATLFPRPDGHRIPVVSGLVSSRQWMADAMGVAPELRSFEGIMTHWYSPLAESDFRLAQPTPLFPRLELEEEPA